MTPDADRAGAAGAEGSVRPALCEAPPLVPIGEDTWRIFTLLKKSRKLARSLEKDGFPASGKDQLASIERRVREFRRRFKELEQLLRTRDLDLSLADAAVVRLQRQLAGASEEASRSSIERSLDHAVRHRDHVIAVMRSRNAYVARLQELYHHVRQLHSHLMMVDTAAPAEADDIVGEIDALVGAVDAVDVVRKEVHSTLEQRRAASRRAGGSTG